MNKKQTKKKKEHHATSTRPDVAALPSKLLSTGCYWNNQFDDITTYWPITSNYWNNLNSIAVIYWYFPRNSLNKQHKSYFQSIKYKMWLRFILSQFDTSESTTNHNQIHNDYTNTYKTIEKDLTGHNVLKIRVPIIVNTFIFAPYREHKRIDDIRQFSSQWCFCIKQKNRFVILIRDLVIDTQSIKTIHRIRRSCRILFSLNYLRFKSK